MKYLKLEPQKTGYSVSQVRETMTVGELKSLLEYYDDELPIYLSFDNGYTYGGITEYEFNEVEDGKDE